MAQGNSDEGTALATASEGIDRAIRPVSRDSIGHLTAQGFTFEKVLSLPDGAQIQGIFRGEGEPVEVPDPVTGEVRPLRTWKIEVGPGLIVRLISTARMDRDFPRGTVGTEVVVIRAGTGRTKAGRQFADVHVSFKAAK